MGRAYSADEAYLTWLIKQVEPLSNPNPDRTHHILLEQMLTTRFEVINEFDRNRADYGLYLRDQFLADEGYEPETLFDGPCSVLEMLIPLAESLTEQTIGLPIYREVMGSFWFMVDNLGLYRYTDSAYLGDETCRDEVDSILARFNDRAYQYNGLGGLFPLEHPQKDQREVDIWYQMMAYILENVD